MNSLAKTSTSGQAGGVDQCFWNVGRESRPVAPMLAGEQKADVAIIGGGYTGLSAAYHLKTADPSLDVVVLEGERVGFGASGRNGGFAMTLFGSSAFQMKALHGSERVREAHHFMERSIAELEATIARHAIDCDYERNGFLRIATAPAYVARIQAEVELFKSLGVDGIEWVDSEWLNARVRSAGFLGACWEPGCGSLHPGKWVDGLRRIATEAGARIYEQSPVMAVRREGGRHRLTTPGGTISADKIVYATNGYSHLVPGVRFSQMPAFAYIIVTEPLSEAQLQTIGWQGREAIEDGRNFMHFFRLMRDRRLLVGGGPGFVPFGRNMNGDASPKAWDHLQRFVGQTFPALKDVRVAYRWGGPFSMTADFTPMIGTMHSGSAVYSVGCTGHGVSMTQMNGQIIRDLVLGRKTDLTDLWFVNRWALPTPPEPIRSIAVRVAMASMQLDDWWCERGAART